MELSSRDRLKEIVRKKLRERNTITNEESTTASADGYNTPFAFGKDTKGDINRKVKSAGKGFEFAKSIDEAILTEDIDSLYLAAILVAQAAMLGGNLAMLAGKHIDSKGVFPNIDDVKRWWKNRKDDKAVKSIIAKIKSDPEMIEFFKMSQTQQRGKFRKLVASKLSGEELQYLNRINKTDLQKNELAENRWLALKKDETRSPEQKINLGVREIKNQLAEVEKFLGWYNKLKMENGVKNEDFYKRTNTSIFRIKERLNKIARTIIDF